MAGAGAGAGPRARLLRAEPHQLRGPVPGRRRLRLPVLPRHAHVVHRLLPQQLLRLPVVLLRRRRRPAGAHTRRVGEACGAGAGAAAASRAQEPERGHGQDRRGPTLRLRSRHRRGVWQEPELRRPRRRRWAEVEGRACADGLINSIAAPRSLNLQSSVFPLGVCRNLQPCRACCKLFVSFVAL